MRTMGRIRLMRRISHMRPAEFLAKEFRASFTRAGKSPQSCGLSGLARVLVVSPIAMPTVLRSLPNIRVSRQGRMA